MVQKKCNKCQLEKNINSFYKRKSGLLGRAESCKDCRRLYQRNYNLNNKEKRKAAARIWHIKNKEKRAEYCKKWRNENPGYFKFYYKQNTERRLSINKRWSLKNPDRIKAYELVRYQKKLGKLIPSEKCMVCGQTSDKIQAHHHDYSKPLAVIWVCLSCHLYIHKSVRKII